MASRHVGKGSGPGSGEGTRALTDLAVPTLVDSQLARFSLESMRVTKTRDVDPRSVLRALSAPGGCQVMAVDIGGDKLIAARYRVMEGALCRVGTPVIEERAGGVGYLDALEDVLGRAQSDHVPVGVSYAGPIRGSRVLAGVNVPIFTSEFHSRYGGDFKALGPGITLVNDAEAGLLAASLEAARRYPESRQVIYVINGSGIGAAALRNNEIFTAEPGHVEADSALNLFGQHHTCGLLGAGYVCLERLGASKAGIEDIWAQQRGERLPGREIARAYLAGDELALRLYDTSAFVTAHIVTGMARVFGMLEDWGSTIVVGHGGTFQVPGYGERVLSIVAQDLARETRLLMTKDFSLNACLDGAAVAGIGGLA